MIAGIDADANAVAAGTGLLTDFVGEGIQQAHGKVVDTVEVHVLQRM